MQRIKHLLANVSVLNLLLSGVLVFIGQYMALPLLNAHVKFSLPKVRTAALEKKSTAEKSDEKSPSPSDYMVIAEQNLFHPDRVIPVPKVEAPPLPKPEFVLYGTLITDNVQIAYMNDKKANGPKKGPQVNEKQIALRKGESLSGFSLKEITNQQVTMQRGEEKILVSLNDAKARQLGPATMPGAQNAVATPTPQNPTQPQKPVSRNLPPERQKQINSFLDAFKKR